MPMKRWKPSRAKKLSPESRARVDAAVRGELAKLGNLTIDELVAVADQHTKLAAKATVEARRRRTEAETKAKLRKGRGGGQPRDSITSPKVPPKEG